MTQTFEERVEEVLGELHGMAWPLLDEPEKRRIVGKVVRGIDRYGDSGRAWERALGVAHATLVGRIDRFRRSEPVDGPRTDQANAKIRLRHVRSGLKDPGVRELVKDDRNAASEVRRLAKELEAEEAHEPSGRKAKEPTSETQNIAALAHLADAREALHQGVTGADFPAMSEHQRANVEVLLRAMEGDFAVARDSLAGGISDEAIAAFMGGGQ